MTPPYVPPTVSVLFDIDSARSVSRADTVPLRVPLAERRWSWAAVAATVVVVALVCGAASFEVATWLVEGMRGRQ